MSKDSLKFEQCLKRQKAAKWLVQNDAFVRGFVMQSRQSPEAAVLCAAMYGQQVESRLAEATEQMTVTAEERFMELGRQYRARIEAAQWQALVGSTSLPQVPPPPPGMQLPT